MTKKKNIFTSWSGQSSQSSDKSSHCREKNSGPQRSPRSNSEEDSGIKEMQDGATSPLKMKELDYKQKDKVRYGEASNEPFLLQPSTDRVIGQKRKQLKVYRPKSQVVPYNWRTKQYCRMSTSDCLTRPRRMYL